MWRADRYDRHRTAHRRTGPRGGRYDREYEGSYGPRGSEPPTYERRAYEPGAYGPHAYDGGEFDRTTHEHGSFYPYVHDRAGFGRTAFDGNSYDRGGYGEGGFDDVGLDHVARAPRRPRRAPPPELDARWAAPSHRRRREPRGPWRRAWQPDEWWHAIGPEPRADYDWAYEARRPERYGWTGETGRG